VGCEHDSFLFFNEMAHNAPAHLRKEKTYWCIKINKGLIASSLSGIFNKVIVHKKHKNKCVEVFKHKLEFINQVVPSMLHITSCIQNQEYDI